MTNLTNHPGSWLRDDAAKAFDRAEAAHGVFDVNSAGRHDFEQQGLINRWDEGGASNRPPYLYPPARPASASNHVKNGGVAIDIGNWREFAKVCRAFGFVHSYPGNDPVHFDFIGGPQGRGGYADGSAELGVFQEKLIKMGHDLGPWGADKKFGELTKAATLHEQKMAEKNGFPGGDVLDDGIPGPRTNAYLDWWLVGRHTTTAPASRGGNPFGIPSVEGLQKIAKLYGYKGGLDNDWGGGSAGGFAEFLRRNHGYRGNDVLGPVMWAAIARWLRKPHSYGSHVGNDTPGPVMRAALQRAEEANEREL